MTLFCDRAKEQVELCKQTQKTEIGILTPDMYSPVDIYDKDGNGYIIQGDSAGYLHLIDGKEGNIKSSVLLNGNIESSPAVFNNVLVVATRNGTIYGVKVK